MLEVPQIHVTPAKLPTPGPVPVHGNLVPALPNYLNYVWTLVIYDRRNPLDGKTEEQNDHLALILSPEECWSFRNQEVDHYSEAQVRDSTVEDTPAAAGSPMVEKCPDIKAEEAELDPWSMELLEFMADDRYSRKQDASFSETTRFLSQTIPDAASAFTWHSFLDAAAWNRADHSLYNAINATMALLPATFHPVVVDEML
ncbi:hypothetical protein PISMIDRAFT_10543 [Pisolithus microcarpus 441]|uniref:Uncharacterized protein n=1 Tax=Pisolithus microcarpus 441 TaxID=765257 RepID=A0A0C9Z4B5_9AGAM|nr:hypothetical protein PISMIDRAFT_10543 [Pisolithus microcarpus 441]